MMLFQSLQKVFSKPQYALLSVIVGIGIFALAVWLPNLPLIIQIMGYHEVSFSQKIGLPISLLQSITTNFTLISAIYTIAISILFGIYVAMMSYFFQIQNPAVCKINS